MKCPNCNADLSPDERFCGACGHAVSEANPPSSTHMKCAHCGAQLAAGEHFCGACGTSVEQRPVDFTNVSRTGEQVPSTGHHLGWVIGLTVAVAVVLVAVGVGWWKWGGLFQSKAKPEGPGAATGTLDSVATKTKTTFSGPTGSIDGEVSDAETGKGLAGARVTIEGTNLGAVTDSEGNYLISNVPRGLYTIKVSSFGFEAVRIPNIPIEGEYNSLVIELSPTTAEVDTQSHMDAIFRELPHPKTRNR